MSVLEGGCLCGAVRYRIEGGLGGADACYCHCETCRKAAGAPVVAWVTFPRARLKVTKGATASFSASDRAVREFCPDCGTQLFFTYVKGPEETDVTVASLDDPDAVRPQQHIWHESRVHWLEIEDELPRFEREGPDAPEEWKEEGGRAAG